MGPEHPVSVPSMPVLLTYSRRKGRKDRNFGGGIKAVSREEEVKECVTPEVVCAGAADLGRMTIKELQSLATGNGITVRGGKATLVSALKHVLDSKYDAWAGNTATGSENTRSTLQNGLDKEEQSGTNTHCAGNFLSEGSTQISETKQKRSRKNLLSPQKVAPKDLLLEQHFTEETNDSSGSAQIRETKQKRERRKKPLCGDCQVDHNFAADANTHSGGKSQIARTEAFTGEHREVVPQCADECLNSGKPWTLLAHKKPQPDWVPYDPEIMRPPPLSDGTKFVKIISWNVNGLRALLKQENYPVLQLAHTENFDVLCLQETKLQEKDAEKLKDGLLDGYENSFWTCSASKLGYSGTAIISKMRPLSVKYGLGIADHDTEGRLVTVEFDSFFLLSGYVPNSGEGLKRLSYRVCHWDPSLSEYMKELEKLKPVILTGDLNCAHEEIDIFNPAGNRRSAGFTNEERESFGKNFLSKGFVDSFRKQHAGVIGYTYWGYRHGGRTTNKGWRLDYFLVSGSIAANVHDSYIMPDVTGSDHCPIGLILRI